MGDFDVNKLIHEDISETLGDRNSWKTRQEKGYRLGSSGNSRHRHGPNAKLASLARAGRLNSTKRGRKLPMEEKEEKLDDEESPTSMMILFHVFKTGMDDRPPSIDETIFAECLTKSSFKAVRRTRYVVAGVKNVRKACVYFEDMEDAMTVWERFSSKVMGNYRRVCHMGDQLHVHAVSKRPVHPGSVEDPFRETNQKANNQRKRTSPETKRVVTVEVKDMDLPTLLDFLGEDIIMVQEAFERYSSPRRSIIGDQDTLANALEHAGYPMRSKDLQWLCKVFKIGNAEVFGGVNMETFVRICAHLGNTKEVHEKVQFNDPIVPLENAKQIFDRLKLFPSDDFISISDVPEVLRSLRLSRSDINDAMDIFEDQDDIRTVNWFQFQNVIAEFL